MNIKELPLNDEELGVLDHFMLYRSFKTDDEIGERPYDENFDEGLISLNELDGFLTAIVSGPVMVPPSAWIPLLWGDDEPVFESEDEFSLLFSLIMRHMNHIAQVLNEQPGNFNPLFECRMIKGKARYIVDDWCEGYMLAVNLNKGLWIGHSTSHDEHLERICGFTQDTDWAGSDQTPMVKGDERAEVVWHAANAIHQHWLSLRMEHAPEMASPKVGRNQPCPCGSGKKYKKCCLH